MKSIFTIFFLFSSILFFSSSLNAHEKLNREIDIQVEYLTPRVGHIEASLVVQASPEEFWSVINKWDELYTYIPGLLYSKAIGEHQAKALISENPKSFDRVLEIVQKHSKNPGEKYKQEGKKKRVFYLLEQFDFPWPFSNRWMLYKCIQDSDSKRRIYSQKHELVAGTFKSEHGSWSARVYGNNPKAALISYSSTTDVGIRLPTVVAKAVARNATVKMVKALRKRAEESVKP